MRNYSPALLCAVVLCCLPAYARDWKSPSGKVLLQGEFLGQDVSIVLVRTADGANRHVELKELCLEDQAYVAQQEAAYRTAVPKELVIKPSVAWDTINVMGSAPVSEAVVVVTLAAQSQEIAHSSRAGDVQIEMIESDAEPPLTLSAHTPGAQGHLSPVDHNSIINRPPSHGMLFQVKLTAGDGPITRIRRLKGSFKVLTGDPETIAVPYFLKAKDLRIENPLLKELDVTMVANRPGARMDVIRSFMPQFKTYSLDLLSNPQKVARVLATDPAGNKVDNTNLGWYSSGNEFAYHFGFREPIRDDTELRITLLRNLHEVRIPFDVRDLDVPKFTKDANRRAAQTRSVEP